MSGQSKKSWRSWVPEWARDWQRRTRLKRRRNALADHYSQQLDAATHSFDKQKIVHDWSSEAQGAENELAELESYRIRRRADRWGVEVPDDVLVEAEDGGFYVGANYQPRIKRQIREARRESIKFWIGLFVQVMAALTGIAGAIIGILSFLRRGSN
jgi:hypothetical protein